MRKILIAAATVAFGASAAYAAEMGMDCCKDCACCEDMDKKGDKHGDKHPAPAPTPAPQPK